MTTDYRAELQRLVKAYDDHGGKWPENEVEALHQAVERARTALAQPEPEGLTDEELLAIAAASIDPYESCGIAIGEYEAETECAVEVYGSELIVFARAVLARWGRAVIKPVPVSERPILKSSNFNDANGHCWCGMCTSIDITKDLPMETPSSWELREPCAQDDCVLPHYALPVPTFTETP